MSKTVITSDKAPAAIGTYSQAIKAGNTVYMSGQIPLDPVSMELVEGFEALTGFRPELFQNHLWRVARLAEQNDAGPQFDRTLHLGLCGDWTTGQKVEGAWLSGQALASEISLRPTP
jgi:hypothetical protein